MKNNFISQKGSIMIEALAMLGLIAMVTPVLYRKAAERTTELEDINVASQIRMVSQAVDAYLKDNYRILKDDDNFPPNTQRLINQNEENDIQDYLPQGFNLGDATKLFDNFRIAIKKVDSGDNSKFTSAVVANLRNDMTKSRAAKIASMIGVAGGIYDGTNFQGSQGAWSASPNDFSFNVNTDPIRNNSLVAISNEAINSVVGQVDPSQVLYRVGGDTERNTMQTTLYMGGNDIMDVHDIHMDGVIHSSGPVIDYNTQIDNLPFIPTNISDLISDYTQGNLEIGQGGSANLSANNGTFNKVITNGDGIEIRGQGNLTTNGGNIYVGNGGNIVMQSTEGGNKGNISGVGTITAQTGIFDTVTATSVTADSGIFDYLELNGDLDMKGNDIINVGTISGNTADFSHLHAHSSLSVGVDHNGETGYLYVGPDQESRTAATLFVGQNGIRVNAESGKTMTLDDAGLNVVYEAASVDASGNTIPGTGKYLSLNNNFEVSSNNFNLSGDAMTVSLDGNANKMQFAQGNLAIGGSNVNVADGIGSATGDTTTGFSYDGNNVLITRDGVIRLVSPADAPGQGENHGFIEARRLVSDSPYNVSSYKDQVDANNASFNVKDNAWFPSTYSGYTGYDTYQVNPAYTSVMNDIKLASRGGARLSDILPDYINKGIYVAENTTNLTNFNWESYARISDETQFRSLLSEGNNTCGPSVGTCITSPWLGFIPTPQCPPGYNKVITIEPFRWNMAEVYEVYPDDPDADIFDYTDPSGITFDNHMKQLGRSNLSSKLSNNGYNDEYNISVSEDENVNHTVSITKAPLLFQANTWLNSTLQDHYKDDNTHLGWSVIMGFLYSLESGQYRDLYNLVLSTNYTGQVGDVAWDLFPVYQKQLAGVARVYCSFNRFVNIYDSSGNWDNGYWKWGSDTPVYKYDQLKRVRYGSDNFGAIDDFYTDPNSKDENWVSQVNDPSLNYKEAW